MEKDELDKLVKDETYSRKGLGWMALIVLIITILAITLNWRVGWLPPHP